MPRTPAPFAVLVILAALAAALVLAPSAGATDVSVKKAWDGNDKQFTKLGRQERKAFRHWTRSGFTDSAPVLRPLKAAIKLLRVNTANVKAEDPSSALGRKAKKYALRCNASFRLNLIYLARGVRLTTAGKRGAGKRRFAKADRYLARSRRQAKVAKKLFKQAAAG